MELQDLPKPVSNTEKYLSFLSGNEIDLPKPISNIDKYLYYLCINGGVGSGSGGSKADWTTNIEVGGLSSETDLTGLTSLEILNKITRKYINCSATAVYSQNNSVVENKTSFNLIVNAKSLKNGDYNLTKISLYRDGKLIETKDVTDISQTISFSQINSISSNTSFTLKTIDSNNVNVAFGTKNYTFVNPTFYGAVNSGSQITETVIRSLTKQVRTKADVTEKYTTSGIQKIVFASEWELKSIINQNNYEVLSNFTLSRVTINDVSYYVYSLDGVNLSGFNYTFKYK